MYIQSYMYCKLYMQDLPFQHLNCSCRYEMKTPQFHYEAHKYNECLKCTDVVNPKSPRH